MAEPRAPRDLPRLTVRGWGLIAASLVAFVLTQVFRRQEIAYLACFLLAVPVAAFVWVAVRRVALSVRRRFTPESGSVGQAITATVFVQNWGTMRTPAAVWVERADAPLRASEPAPLPPLPGYSSSTVDEPALSLLRYRLDTRFRGAHPIGPFEVTLTDPFGCAVRRLRFGDMETVLITPTVYELARIDLRLSTGDGAEQMSRRLVGAGEQDVIARKYLPGDSIRRVHWPATAKHGELMVRQDDQRNDQDAVILLDASSFAAAAEAVGAAGGHVADAEYDPAFEWAVSAVGSVAVHLMNEGYGVRLVGHSAVGEHDDETVFTAPHGASLVLRSLAFAHSDALHDPLDFRAAVEQASLTSPDAPPVFAFVAAVAGAAERVRELAGMSSHPVAFVVSGPRRSGGRGGVRADAAGVAAVAAELRASGWTALDCGADDALPALWKALGDARGIG